jgi:hypothetical protein
MTKGQIINRLQANNKLLNRMWELLADSEDHDRLEHDVGKQISKNNKMIFEAMGAAS